MIQMKTQREMLSDERADTCIHAALLEERLDTLLLCGIGLLVWRRRLRFSDLVSTGAAHGCTVSMPAGWAAPRRATGGLASWSGTSGESVGSAAGAAASSASFAAALARWRRTRL
jgi:hypothetical protein